MIAVVLAGGQGARMRQVSHGTPKQLLPVGNETLIERLLRQLHQEGAKRLVICVPALGAGLDEMVQSYAKGRFPVRTIPSHGSKAEDLVACLEARGNVADDVVLTMGDLVLEDGVLSEFVGAGIPNGFDIVVGYTKSTVGCSGVRLVGNVCGFTRAETHEDRFSSGVYLMTKHGCEVVIWCWDRAEARMHMLMDRAVKEVGTTCRSMEGAVDVNTPEIYQMALGIVSKENS